MNLIKWYVRVTHVPTGITMTCTSEHFRLQYQARDAAIKYVKSRLAMLGYAPSLLKIEHIGEDYEPCE